MIAPVVEAQAQRPLRRGFFENSLDGSNRRKLEVYKGFAIIRSWRE